MRLGKVTECRSLRLHRLQAGGHERGLVYLYNAGCLHNRRSFLAFRKALGAFAIYVDARKLLAVVIVDRYLPVAVPAAAIPADPGGLAGLRLFPHDGVALAD